MSNIDSVYTYHVCVLVCVDIPLTLYLSVAQVDYNIEKHQLLPKVCHLYVASATYFNDAITLSNSRINKNLMLNTSCEYHDCANLMNTLIIVRSLV